MKILILSCDTGQGHNSAAHAVEEALKRRRKGQPPVSDDKSGIEAAHSDL